MEERLIDKDQILAVMVENTLLLPETYTLSSGGRTLILTNPLSEGERWSIKLLFSLQSVVGLVDAVVYEEMSGETQ